MFGLFKKKPAPEGPVNFVMAIEIAASAQDVYALLDWADPRNAKRQLGHEVTQLAPDTFRLVMQGMEDIPFEFRVLEAKPHGEYSMICDPMPPVGRRKYTRETYVIESLGENACQVDLIVEAEFIDGISMREYKQEMELGMLSNYNALAKFKLHAEHGVDAVRIADGQMIVELPSENAA